MNTALKAPRSKSPLYLGRTISAVGEHIIAGVARVQQPIHLLAVVHCRIGHRIMPDQLVLGVRVHMVLLAEELRPFFLVQLASRSFCRTLAGLCFSRLCYAPSLQLGVLVRELRLPPRQY